MKNLDQTSTDDRHLRHRDGPLRLAAVLLMMGFVLFVTMTLLHPGGPANDHRVIFSEYAASDTWNLVHLGQFAGIALFVAGLLVLYHALGIQAGGAGWVARFGGISAALALGLYAVLQAIDGVALKQAVDAWISAPASEAEARFASAEAIRWAEWGSRSFQTLMLGLALILLGLAVASTAKLPKAIGYLMVLSGITYLVQSWVLGSEGFSETNTMAILAGYVLISVWVGWLAVVAWRSDREGLRTTA